VISILIPVLGRGHQIAPLLENITSATSTKHHVVFICSRKDTEARQACEASGAQTLIYMGPKGGDFAAKIALAYSSTTGEWIFQGATDIEFTPGWDTAALRVARETGALVVGTNDQGNPSVVSGKHSTHTLIARSYCDDPGASMDGPGNVFSLAYAHNFCDQELVNLAKARGVWAFSADSIVRHDHPHWSRAPMDGTYALGLSSFGQDRITFNRRRMLWANAR